MVLHGKLVYSALLASSLYSASVKHESIIADLLPVLIIFCACVRGGFHAGSMTTPTN